MGDLERAFANSGGLDPWDIADVIEPAETVEAVTPHGTYSFVITGAARYSDGRAILTLKEI